MKSIQRLELGTEQDICNSRMLVISLEGGKFCWIWLNLSYVLCFPGTVYPFVYIQNIMCTLEIRAHVTNLTRSTKGTCQNFLYLYLVSSGAFSVGEPRFTSNINSFEAILCSRQICFSPNSWDSFTILWFLSIKLQLSNCQTIWNETYRVTDSISQNHLTIRHIDIK